jgi:rhodanese-related sulfurtransferase
MMEEQRSAEEQIGVTRVTADEIKERLDRGEPIVFIDARNPQAWGEADEKIAGAIRVPADEVDEHLDEIPKGRSVVTYCT